MKQPKVTQRSSVGFPQTPSKDKPLSTRDWSLVKIGIAVTLGSTFALALPGCSSGHAALQPQAPASCPTYYAYTADEEKSILNELKLYAPEIPYTTHAMADYGRVRAQVDKCRKSTKD